MTRYDKPLTLEQIAAVQDEDIDFSDVPELDEDFWRDAKIVEPDRTEQITLRVKGSVLAYFKASGKGYQTRINRVLESYVQRAQSQAGREFQQNLEQFQQNPVLKEFERIQQNLEQSPAIKAIPAEPGQNSSVPAEQPGAVPAEPGAVPAEPGAQGIRAYPAKPGAEPGDQGDWAVPAEPGAVPAEPGIQGIRAYPAGPGADCGVPGVWQESAAAKMKQAREMLGGVDGARRAR